MLQQAQATLDSLYGTLRDVQDIELDTEVSLEGEAFYAGLHDAMMAFFGDKWDRPGQGLSLEMIRTTFEKKGYATEGCEAVAACIESIEMARYTGSSAASREQLLDKAKAAIKTCDEVMA